MYLARSDQRKALIEKTISTADAAALLGVSSKWVQELQKKGYVKSAGRGQWVLADVVQGYIGFLKDETKRNSKSAAASRVTDARTREIELKIAQREGRLIDRDEHEAVLELVTGRYLGSLGGIGAQITREPEERDRINRIIDQERERLADYFEEIAERTLAFGEDDEAGEGMSAA